MFRKNNIIYFKSQILFRLKNENIFNIFLIHSLKKNAFLVYLFLN